VRETVWQQRIRRAEKLAAAHSFAGEILGFYIHVARFQEDLYRRNPERVAEFGKFLALVVELGPARVSQDAEKLMQSPETQSSLLETIWSGAGPSTSQQFLAFAYLQPFAEFARGAAHLQLENYSSSICPWCNRRPALGVLRQQGDAGQRNLICGFCMAEWPFRRVVCAGCGEEEPTKLPVYSAAEMPHIRVECCDSCHGYIKSVDLTKNGLAEPVVDELASIPLNLWAQERGYTKLHPNLLGM
jgi:FdhE protein